MRNQQQPTAAKKITNAEVLTRTVTEFNSSMSARTQLTDADRATLDDITARFTAYQGEVGVDARASGEIGNSMAEAEQSLNEYVSIVCGQEERWIGDHVIEAPALESPAVRSAVAGIGRRFVEKIGAIETARNAASSAHAAGELAEEQALEAAMRNPEIKWVVDALIFVGQEASAKNDERRRQDAKFDQHDGPRPAPLPAGDDASVEALFSALEARFRYKGIAIAVDHLPAIVDRMYAKRRTLAAA